MTALQRLASSLLAALGLLIANPIRAADDETNLKSRIDPLVQPYLDAEVVVGLALGVIHDGQSQTFGYGRLSANDAGPPTGDTVYEIGSASKVFTGVLLADAVVHDRVKLSTPAAELLPAGAAMPEIVGRAITLQDLSTHVSGLPSLPDTFKPADMNNPYADFQPKDLYAFLKSHKLRRAPGKEAEYSNLAVGLLGSLLADAEHTSYEKLLSRDITTPLKMTSTSITLTPDQQRRLAPPHAAAGVPAHNWDLPTLAGAGAIRSTAGDMLKFAHANLAPPQDKLGEAMNLAWEIHQKPLEDGDFAMGLGWHVAHDGSTRWHNGQTGGYHSMILVSRDLKLAVVLLTNTATMEVDVLGQDIMRMLGGAKVEPRKFEKAVTIRPEVMHKLEGQYEIIPEFVLTVTVDDGKLMVGATGQQTFEVYPRSETEWYYKVVDATLIFKFNSDGQCESLELLQGGARQTARRKPTP
jgi:D-alanyl-D-alanine-carboxypeptidase/D-alanyl-D-alanine-endopeptidase